MYTMAELAKLRVYVPRKPSRRNKKEGTEPDPKRAGKVHNLVFAPNGRVVVGFMVKRPDIAGMVKQPDRFLALDSVVRAEDGLHVVGGEDSFDERACKRLGLDLDRCYVWAGMPVSTEGGKYLGYVMDARFNEVTGEVDCFCAQEGSTAASLVGTFEIPAAWLVRYEDDTMVVRDAAASMELSGGLAGKAGEGYANAKEGAKKAAAAAGKAAGEAVDKGAHALGHAIGGVKRSDAAKKATKAVGEQLGKTRGMFSGFMREFKDASK